MGRLDKEQFHDRVNANGVDDWASSTNAHRNCSHDLGSAAMEGGKELGRLASGSDMTTGRKTGGCSRCSAATTGYSTQNYTRAQPEALIVATED